jgi:RNA polymerase sigma-70 factor (ECF subfamily)
MKMMNNIPPEILLKKARELDHEVLTVIYDRYSDALFAYAYKHIGDSQTAEDLVSETFFRFLGALERGGGPEKHLKAYLYRITHNLITDLYRREQPPTLELDENQVKEEGPGPRGLLAAQQDAEQVRRALRLLTPEQRQVVALRFLEGWSSLEIAQAMEKSLGSIKALQHRGLAALQRLLLEDEVPPGEQESKP